MTEKKLHKLLKDIEKLDTIDTISEIARKMSNVVIKDKNMSIENKMRFLFLYYQHISECKTNSLLLIYSKEEKHSIIKKIKKRLHIQ